MPYTVLEPEQKPFTVIEPESKRFTVIEPEAQGNVQGLNKTPFLLEQGKNLVGWAKYLSDKYNLMGPVLPLSKIPGVHVNTENPEFAGHPTVAAIGGGLNRATETVEGLTNPLMLGAAIASGGESAIAQVLRPLLASFFGAHVLGQDLPQALGTGSVELMPEKPLPAKGGRMSLLGGLTRSYPGAASSFSPAEKGGAVADIGLNTAFGALLAHSLASRAGAPTSPEMVRPQMARPTIADIQEGNGARPMIGPERQLGQGVRFVSGGTPGTTVEAGQAPVIERPQTFKELSGEAFEEGMVGSQEAVDPVSNLFGKTAQGVHNSIIKGDFDSARQVLNEAAKTWPLMKTSVEETKAFNSLYKKLQEQVGVAERGEGYTPLEPQSYARPTKKQAINTARESIFDRMAREHVEGKGIAPNINPNASGSGGPKFTEEIVDMFDRLLQMGTDKMGKVDAKQAVAKLRNTLGPESFAWKALERAGILGWHKQGDRIKPEELKKKIGEKGERVEVRKFGEEQEKLTSKQKEFVSLRHWMDSLPNTARDFLRRRMGRGPDLTSIDRYHSALWGEPFNELDLKQVNRLIELSNDPETYHVKENAAHWSTIAPKPESEMPGYVELAVVRPLKRKFTTTDADREAEGYSPDKIREETGEQFPSSHSFPPNTIGFGRAYEETLPGKGKGLNIIEVQSDWAQEQRDAREMAEVKPTSERDAQAQSEELERLKKTDDPLLAHYERSVLRKLIDHAIEKGLKWVAVSDPETAMMTEGHDRGYSQGGNEGARSPQEPGMRLHYGRTLPEILEELTGQKGEKVSFGEHKMAFKEISNYEAREMGGEGAQGGRTQRSDLIFRNPDGTPKTDVSGLLYDLSKVDEIRKGNTSGMKIKLNPKANESGGPKFTEEMMDELFPEGFGEGLLTTKAGAQKFARRGEKGRFEKKTVGEKEAQVKVNESAEQRKLGQERAMQRQAERQDLSQQRPGESGGPGFTEAMVELIDRLKVDRDTFANFLNPAVKGIKKSIVAMRDAVDNASFTTANKGEQHVTLASTKTFGKDAEKAREAALVAIVAKNDPKMLAKFESQARKAGNKSAIAAVQFARANWPRIQSIVKAAQDVDAMNVSMATTYGVKVPTLESYLKSLYKKGRRGLIFGSSTIGPKASAMAKTYGNLFDAIEAGEKPTTLDAAAMIGQRTVEAQMEINSKLWVDNFKHVNDPGSRQPIVTRLGKLGFPPDGYEKVPGLNIAALKGYGRLFRAITGESALEHPGFQAALNLVAFAKHGTLAFDSFHAFRVANFAKSLGAEGYKKGLSLLEFSKSDLNEAIAQGLLPKEARAYVDEIVDVPQGKFTRREIASLFIRSGLNIGRHSEMMYASFMRTFPGLRETFGASQRFIFDKLSRGAMMESAQIEFERVAKEHPTWTREQVTRNISADLNQRFGNIGRQGTFKSKTSQDIASLLLLAPRWVDAMARSEVGSAGQAVKALTPGKEFGKMGTLGRSTTRIVAAYFVATQAANLILNGHTTFQNANNKGHELDLFVPLPGKGLWVSPLSVAAELTHDVIRFTRKDEDSLVSAFSRIGGNKSSPFLSAVDTLRTGRDWKGEKIEGSWNRVKEAALAYANPTPLPLRQLATSAREKDIVPAARQGLAMLGIKAEPESFGDVKKRKVEELGKASFRDRARLEAELKASRPVPSDQAMIASAERRMEENLRNRDHLKESLSPELQKWMKDKGLHITGFSPNLSEHKNKISLTQPEIDHYMKLLTSEYTRILGPWVGYDMTQKQLDVKLDHARARARTQLKNDIKSGSIIEQNEKPKKRFSFMNGQ